MKIEIKFVRNQAPANPRKKTLGRVVALLALLAIVLAIPASAKYVGEGSAVFSTALDSALYTGTSPVTVTGTAIGLTPGMYTYPTTETLTGETYDGWPVYIRRFTGTITCAANTQHEIHVATGLYTGTTVWRIVDCGGSWYYDSGASRGNTALFSCAKDGSVSSGIYIGAGGELGFHSFSSTMARTNEPYSIWVKYVKG